MMGQYTFQGLTERAEPPTVSTECYRLVEAMAHCVFGLPQLPQGWSQRLDWPTKCIKQEQKCHTICLKLCSELAIRKLKHSQCTQRRHSAFFQLDCSIHIFIKIVRPLFSMHSVGNFYYNALCLPLKHIAYHVSIAQHSITSVVINSILFCINILCVFIIWLSTLLTFLFHEIIYL